MLSQKAQNTIEVGAGASISIGSLIMDATEAIQVLGIWAGALLACVGLYGAIKREFFNNDTKT